MKPINMTREWQIQAKGWAAVAQEQREKIERALQLLREAPGVRNDSDDVWCEGWQKVQQAVQILEGNSDD